MKVQVRQGIFETNSSSTHSVTVTSKSIYEKWKSGEMLFNMNENKFLPKEEGEMYNIDAEKRFSLDENWKEDPYYIQAMYVDYETFEMIIDESDFVAETANVDGIDMIAFSIYCYDC